MATTIAIVLLTFMALLAISFDRKSKLTFVLLSAAAGTILVILQLRSNIVFVNKYRQYDLKQWIYLIAYAVPTVIIWIHGIKDFVSKLKERSKQGRRPSRRETEEENARLKETHEQDEKEKAQMSERIAQLERENSGRNRTWVITPKKGSKIGSFFQCFKVKNA